MNQANSNSNPNPKRRNRKTKRKTQNKLNPNSQSLNNHGDKQPTKENKNGTSKILDKQTASSPRPINICKNNFNFEIKRSSGSELDEFHTPTCEYPEFPNQNSGYNSEKAYEKEFEEGAKFNRSNLEGIPEMGNVHNNVPKGLFPINNGHKVSEKPVETGSTSKFKYRQVKQKPFRKCNGCDTTEGAVNGHAYHRNDKHGSLLKREIDLNDEKNKTVNRFGKIKTKDTLDNCTKNVNKSPEEPLVETKEESNISEHTDTILKDSENCEMYFENEISCNKEIKIVSNHVENHKMLIMEEDIFESANEEILNEKDQDPVLSDRDEPDILNNSIVITKVQDRHCTDDFAGLTNHVDKVNDLNENQMANIWENPVEDKDEHSNAEEIIRNLDDINEKYENNENETGERDLTNIGANLTDRSLVHSDMVEDVLEDEKPVTNPNDSENELLMEVNNSSSEKSTPDTVIEVNFEGKETKLNLTPKSENSLKFENIDDIQCTDENLKEEILPVTEIKPQNIPEFLIKRSMTLGVKPYGNSLRQSATTITNVTSISDENLHLAYDDEFKYMKHEKKRNSFVKTIFSKFKKRKVNSKMQSMKTKFPSNEEKFPENNEYFDDTSIDCNSHAKGLEIDSNKALKSYDESINNFEDIKPIDVDDCEKYETVFLDENKNIVETQVNQLEPKDDESSADIINFEDALKQFDTPKHSMDVNQSDSDKTSEKSNTEKAPKPESPLEVSKKSNKFALFSKSKNNKIFSKFKLKHLSNEHPRENYKCAQLENTNSCKKDHDEMPDVMKNDNQNVKVEVGKLKTPLIDSISVECQTEESVENFLLYEPISCDLEEKTQVELNSIGDTENDLKDNERETVVTELQTNDPQVLDLDRQHPDSERDDNSTLVNKKEEKSKISKSKPKGRFFTLFYKKKNDVETELKRSNSFSDKNRKHKNKDNKEKARGDNQIELDEELIKEFNNVLNSFPVIGTDNEERVKCKNKNEYPLKVAEEDIENKSVQYINDDYLFPDAITPSKIVKFEPEESYNFAFIDDPIIVQQDSLILFKGETKINLFFTEFSAPFASLETLFVSEHSQEIQLLEKSVSPAHSFKRPLSGLINFLSRNR